MSGRAFAPLKKGVDIERTSAKEPASTSSVAADPVSLEEKIRARAYEIYLERGSLDGSSLDDWLSAEAQIHAGQPKKA